MEDLKKFIDLLEPDERWESFAIRDQQTNHLKKYTLADRYNSIEQVVLNNTVPPDVRSQFNVAKMLCVYAWLYYPLHQVAELKAFSTLEMGLRIRFPQFRNFKRLLTCAVEQGYIKDEGMSGIAIDTNDPLSYSRRLPELITSMRNDLAHGTVTLHPGSIFTLNNCAEILNQVFPE